MLPVLGAPVSLCWFIHFLLPRVIFLSKLLSCSILWSICRVALDRVGKFWAVEMCSCCSLFALFSLLFSLHPHCCILFIFIALIFTFSEFTCSYFASLSSFLALLFTYLFLSIIHLCYYMFIYIFMLTNLGDVISWFFFKCPILPETYYAMYLVFYDMCIGGGVQWLSLAFVTCLVLLSIHVGLFSHFHIKKLINKLTSVSSWHPTQFTWLPCAAP